MAGKGMHLSSINYRNPAVSWYWGWNPGGLGCSGGCDGCWARAMAGLITCAQCRRFEVHLHRERLDQPANTKKPGVVLVNFTCDTADLKRSQDEVAEMQQAALKAPWHTYVWLTREPRWFMCAREYATGHWLLPTTWHLGLTIRNQDAVYRDLGDLFFGAMPNAGRWLSLEPLEEDVDLGLDQAHGHIGGPGWRRSDVLQGVIVGHDRRRGEMGTDTLDHVRSVVAQCRDAGVKVYVKQLWIRGALRTDPAEFPADLRLRDLPWAMPMEDQK